MKQCHDQILLVRSCCVCTKLKPYPFLQFGTKPHRGPPTQIIRTECNSRIDFKIQILEKKHCFIKFHNWNEMKSGKSYRNFGKCYSGSFRSFLKNWVNFFGCKMKASKGGTLCGLVCIPMSLKIILVKFLKIFVEINAAILASGYTSVLFFNSKS